MQRPDSEVGDRTGLVGAIALSLLIALAWAIELSPPMAMLLFVIGAALPMAAWTVIVERAHRRPSTGLDFSLRRPAHEVRELTRVKLFGLAATFLLIALAFFGLRMYAAPRHATFFAMLSFALPAIFVLAVPYVAFVTRRMVEPKDGLWHFGMLATLRHDAVDAAKVADHLRGWAIKAFFLPFMVAIFPDLIAGVLRFDPAALPSDPAMLVLFVVKLAFLFDVCFGTIGYLMTFRPLDSHIRSANPFFSGWVAALVCYPPIILMAEGGPLDYRSGTQPWNAWLAGHEVALALWGGAIAALVVVYAWSTVVFGIRFSNLTHRGIVTTGPYRWFKHPAYLSKNLAWWMIHLPFLSTVDASEALRNCLLLGVVNAIYVARARTEERHLMSDPRYRAYAAWIAEHGVLQRAAAALRGRASVARA